MTSSPLTPTQKMKVARLVKEGKSVKQIAYALGEPRGTVGSFMRCHYLTQGGKYLPKRPKPYSRNKSDLDERNCARHMHACGMQIPEIMQELGRSRSAIRKWLSTEG